MNFPFLVKKTTSVADAIAPLKNILVNLEEVLARKQLEAAQARADISNVQERARQEVTALAVNEQNATEEAKQAATVLTRISALLQ